jgi:hypothetical protein
MNKNNQLKIRNKWRKLNIRIPKELRDIIHGYVMSDGFISIDGQLTVDQSIKQKKFVEWLYNKLETLRTNTPINQTTRLDKRTNTQTYSRKFATRALLKGYRAMWYKSYKDNEGNLQYRKTLPTSLACFFNSVFLTLWYAGDGTKMLDQRGVKIEATSFTHEERLKLKALFKNKFNILVQITRAGYSNNVSSSTVSPNKIEDFGRQQWTISINANEYPKFHQLITKMDLIQNLFPNKLHKLKI